MTYQSARTIEWLEGLKTISWTLQQFKAATLDLLLAGIVPPTMLKPFSKSVAEERKVSTNVGPYVLQNAVTRFYRTKSFQLQHRKANQVNEYLNNII
jgi:hypothetical protein